MSDSDTENRLVECPELGAKPPAFVCRQLNPETPVGFVAGYDPEDPDGQLYQAWYHACDEVLMGEGGQGVDCGDRPGRAPRVTGPAVGSGRRGPDLLSSQVRGVDFSALRG